MAKPPAGGVVNHVSKLVDLQHVLDYVINHHNNHYDKCFTVRIDAFTQVQKQTYDKPNNSYDKPNNLSKLLHIYSRKI
jgi:hypothetical protein